MVLFFISYSITMEDIYGNGIILREIWIIPEISPEFAGRNAKLLFKDSAEI